MLFPFFVLSPILILLYEIISLKVEKYCRERGWGYYKIEALPTYFLFGSIFTMCFCCFKYFYTVFCLYQGIKPAIESELEFSEDSTQICQLGFGIAFAMLGVFSKKTPAYHFLNWLRSAYPIYFYTLNGAVVLIAFQLDQFNDHRMLAEIAAGFIVVFVVPHLLVIMVEYDYDYGRIELHPRQKQLTADEFYQFVFNKGRWIHFIIHINFSEEEISYHDGQALCSSCESGCAQKRFFNFVNIPDRILDDIIRILEVQKENHGIRTWFYPYDCEVLARGVIGLNQRYLMLTSFLAHWLLRYYGVRSNQH